MYIKLNICIHAFAFILIHMRECIITHAYYKQTYIKTLTKRWSDMFFFDNDGGVTKLEKNPNLGSTVKHKSGVIV